MSVRHNLGEVARSIRNRAVGVEPAVADVIRKVALVANQTLIMATPVDTGRARANWQVSIGTAIDAEIDSTDVPGAIRRNEVVIKGYRNGNLLLQNNVSYIGRLDAGWSAQAPAGFVARAIQTAARAVARSKVVI